jgi:hypothetical protein
MVTYCVLDGTTRRVSSRSTRSCVPCFKHGEYILDNSAARPSDLLHQRVYRRPPVAYQRPLRRLELPTSTSATTTPRSHFGKAKCYFQFDISTALTFVDRLVFSGLRDLRRPALDAFSCSLFPPPSTRSGAWRSRPRYTRASLCQFKGRQT